MIALDLADPAGLAWAQAQVARHHYLRAQVDPRCYDPDSALTYGSLEDVQAGRARLDRWEIINLARVWLDPRVQRGGADEVPRAASALILAALGRVGYDYLAARPPVDCARPYQLRVCLSYCDTRVHTGYLYRVSRFKLARENARGIQTFYKLLSPLSATQDADIRRLADRSPRSRRIRCERAVAGVRQERLL